MVSLARPGGNLTGLADLQRQLSGKRLELIKETVPRLTRIGVLRDTDSHTATIDPDARESTNRNAANAEAAAFSINHRV